MKPQMILISGWAHDPAILEPLANLLENDFRVLLSSPNDLESTLEQQAEPCWLAGWSMGGMYAMESALNRPQRVSGLVLIGTTARFCASPDYSAGQPETVLRAMIHGLGADPNTSLRDFLAAAALPHTLPPEILAKRVDSARDQGLDTLQKGLKYLLRTDLRARIVLLHMPALIFHGNKDFIVPVEAGQWLASTLFGSFFEEADGMGHDLPVRQPEWIAERIQEHFKVSR